MGVTLQFDRRDLELNLWAYGEDELSAAVPSLSDADIARISERAPLILVSGPTRKDGSSMLIDQSICLAAVEVMTGGARPLNRNRRRAFKDYPGNRA